MNAQRVAVVAGLALSATAIAQTTTREIVAYDGGTSRTGLEWIELGLPTIDPNARVVFAGEELDTESLVYQSIWSASVGSPPALVYDFQLPGIQNPPNVDILVDDLVISARPNSLTMRTELVLGGGAYAVPTHLAADLDCPQYSTFSFINNIRAGYSPFRVRLEDPQQGCSGFSTANDSGLWMLVAPGVALYAREGDSAIGATEGELWGDFIDEGGSPSVNASGKLAFWNPLTGEGVSGINDEAIWSPDISGEMSMVAREGSDIPGSRDTVTSFPIRNVDINDSNQIAVLVNVNSTEVGVWRGVPGDSFASIVRNGDSAPGTSEPTNPSLQRSFTTVFGAPVINAEGNVAFFAHTSFGGSDLVKTVYVASPSGTLTLIARDGDPAPTGGVFEVNSGAVAMNGVGTVIFQADVRFDENTVEHGLWAYTPSAHPCCRIRLIVLTGDVIPVGSSSMTVHAIDAMLDVGGQDGRHSCINDNNDITYRIGDAIGEGVNYAIVRTHIKVLVDCEADANCDGQVNIADFTAFLTKYAAGSECANCDGSTQPPVLNVSDFTCFLTKHNAGCS
jgi:hypothetical protein